MNQKEIGILERAVADDYRNIVGIVVRTNGAIAYENYWNGYTADTAVHVYSVTKSVFSALIGIAIDKGYIKSADTKVLDYFPGYAVRPGETTIQHITVENLLTMTAPYTCETEPYEEFFASGNWVDFALDLLGGPAHTGAFRYSPIVGTHILAGILAAAVGRPILDFATEHLFSPLDIHVPRNVRLRSKEEHFAVMSDKNTSGWVVDPQGINTASWGLFLKPADMAKIGQLYQNGGAWNNRQIIPEAWVSESTKEHSCWGELSYGYLWWIIDSKAHCYAALGDGGNAIYVNDKKNVIVSIAALFTPDTAEPPKDPLALIEGYILNNL